MTRPASPIAIKIGRSRAPADVSDLEQRQAIAQAIRLRGNLDHLGAGRAHRRARSGKIGRHLVEIVRRQDDAAAVCARDEIVEPRLPFDVDELGALLDAPRPAIVGARLRSL